MSQAVNTSEDIKTFTVRFPRPLSKRLAQAALDRDTTMQAITVNAVEEHLDRLDIEQDIKGAKHGKTA